MATAVAFGFVFGVWSLWLAQSWWQAYVEPARKLQSMRRAFIEAAKRGRSYHEVGRAADLTELRIGMQVTDPRDYVRGGVIV